MRGQRLPTAAGVRGPPLVAERGTIDDFAVYSHKYNGMKLRVSVAEIRTAIADYGGMMKEDGYDRSTNDREVSFVSCRAGIWNWNQWLSAVTAALVVLVFAFTACSAPTAIPPVPEGPPPSVPSAATLSIADSGVTEGDHGDDNSMLFEVALSKPSTEQITVMYATSDGTARSGIDYDEAIGTLTFTAGESSKQIIVVVIGDVVDEADEVFTVTLSDASNATVADGTAAGTIQDDDAEINPPTVGRDSVVSYIMWDIGTEVPVQFQLALREGMIYMHDYAVLNDLEEPSLHSTFYLYYQLEALYEAYARATGRTVEEARRHLEIWNVYGEAGYRFIFVNARMIPEHDVPVGLMWLAAHELGHIFQLSSGTIGIFDTDHDKVRVHGPAWLQEGGAEFWAARALSRVGVVDYAQSRDRFLRGAVSTDVELSVCETYSGILAGPGRYQLGAMAVEFLMTQSNEQALFEYWALLSPQTTWQKAFNQTFGMTVDEFYRLFREYRAAGYPDAQ